MTFDDILFSAHSGVRWLLMLVTLMALAKLVIGLLRRAPYDRLTERLMLAFSGLMTLQWILGLILFLALASFDVGYRWEHAVTMTVALALSHMHMRWRKAPDPVRYRASLLIVIAVLALIYVGVARLPQGWG